MAGTAHLIVSQFIFLFIYQGPERSGTAFQIPKSIYESLRNFISFIYFFSYNISFTGHCTDGE